MNKEKIIGLMESIISEKLKKAHHPSTSALAGTVLTYTLWETKGEMRHRLGTQELTFL